MSINVSGNILSSTGFNTSGEITNTPNVVTDGLVLWYDAGNLYCHNSSPNYYDCGYGPQYYSSDPGCPRCNTQLKDMSGYGNDGTLSGATVAYDNTGGYVSLNGSTNVLMTSNVYLGNGNTSWSSCAWVKTTTSVDGLGLGSIFSNRSSGPVYSVLSITLGKICYYSYSNSWFRILGNAIVNNDVWHHLTWVNKSNTTMDMYVDGVIDVSNQSSPSGNNNPIDIFGGSWAGGFVGQISVGMIYLNKELSSSEVLQNFNNGRQRFGI